VGVSDDHAAESSAPDALSPDDAPAVDPAVQAEWDRRYAEHGQLWSGKPNGTLVAEVAGLTPGRVLDVGCGEGADAVWLTRNGWDVTALEVSGVALERAAAHSLAAGADEQRPRDVPESGAGGHHVDDIVLRARKLR